MWGDRLGVDINPVLPGTPPDGYGREIRPAEQYIPVIAEIAEAPGRGIIEPGQAIAVCPGYEDNRILESAAGESVLIVSDGTDLASMSSWRGTRYSHPARSPSEPTSCARAIGAKILLLSGLIPPAT